MTVDIHVKATEGGELLENAQGCYGNGGENREDEHKAEEEQPIGQNQRRVLVRKPTDHYGEWILNKCSLQQIHVTDRLKVLEDKKN